METVEVVGRGLYARIHRNFSATKENDRNVDVSRGHDDFKKNLQTHRRRHVFMEI